MSDFHRGVRDGVRDSWDFYLSQHDVSVPAIFEDAIKDAIKQWMDDHTEEILARIEEQLVDVTELKAAIEASAQEIIRHIDAKP